MTYWFVMAGLLVSALALQLVFFLTDYHWAVFAFGLMGVAAAFIIHVLVPGLFWLARRSFFGEIQRSGSAEMIAEFTGTETPRMRDHRVAVEWIESTKTFNLVGFVMGGHRTHGIHRADYRGAGSTQPLDVAYLPARRHIERIPGISRRGWGVDSPENTCRLEEDSGPAACRGVAISH